MEPVVIIPYEKNKTIDFYEDRFCFAKYEILYESVNGYSYSITHTTGLVYFIPLANSTRIAFTIDDGSKKLKSFNKEIAAGLTYKGKGQARVETIFSELAYCLDKYIAPIVFRKLLEEIVEYGYVEIGGLKICKDHLAIKGFFKEKYLSYSEYGSSITAQGTVTVYSKDNKYFFSCLIGVMNAPILGTLIDCLAEWDINSK